MLMASYVGHFGGRTTGVGGSPRPSQPRIQPTCQRRQDQGNRGHTGILWSQHEETRESCLEKEIMQGTMPGARRI